MKLLNVLIVSFITTFSFSQKASVFKNYIDMKQVHSVVKTSKGIWSATSGGVFYFNFEDSSYIKLTKADGLNGINFTSITIDNNGNVWIGSQNGSIDVYNPKTKSVSNIWEIFQSNKNLKQINDLQCYGDSIFVSTDFGLSIINSQSLNFVDTYNKYGIFPSNIKVLQSIKHKNIIYSATEVGIAVQKQGNFNLSAPESWNTFPLSDISKIGIFNDTLLIAYAYGFKRFYQNSLNDFLVNFNQKNFYDFAQKDDSLIIYYAGEFYFYKDYKLSKFSFPILNVKKLFFVEGNNFYFSNYNGLTIFNSSHNIKNIYPNGPQSNLFYDLAVDSKGTLWCASGTDVTGVGFYKYDGKVWNNYNLSNSSFVLSNSFFNVTTSGSKVFIGNWGRGFLQITNDSIYKNFWVDNTELVGISSDTNYLVIPSLKTDSKNNLWVLNRWSANRKILSVMTSENNWYHYTNKFDSSLELYTKMLIDHYDTKWFVSGDPDRSGLFYFNENNTFSNLNDDKNGFISQSNGLNTNSINAIALDAQGEIWIGTSLGVNIISNPNSVLTQTPQFRVSSSYPLRQQTINCIAVDAINQKWVGTNQGLFVVSPDGNYLIYSYDSKNSPLLSDQVKAITIDNNNGLVYVSTEGGLTSIATTIIQPKDDFSELFLFPSPFILDKSNKHLTIDGLIKDSEIKILNINNKVVNNFSTAGGKITFWDGKDLNGNFVNSGIYFIVASNKDGNKIAKGKIAVINK